MDINLFPGSPTIPLVPMPGEGGGPPNPANPTQQQTQGPGLLGGLSQIGNASTGLGAIGSGLSSLGSGISSGISSGLSGLGGILGLAALAEGGRIDPSSAMQGFAYGGMPGGFPQGQPMQGFGGLPGFAGGQPMMGMPMQRPPMQGAPPMMASPPGMPMQRPQMASPPMQAAGNAAHPVASGLASAAPVAAPVPAPVGHQLPVGNMRRGGRSFADGGDTDMTDVSGSGDDAGLAAIDQAIAPKGGVASATDATPSTWDRWLKGQSFLESPDGSKNPNSSADGFFQFTNATAKDAMAAGIPNPQRGSYAEQAAATKQFIQKFHPNAARCD